MIVCRLTKAAGTRRFCFASREAAGSAFAPCSLFLFCFPKELGKVEGRPTDPM